jgi:hypothetical protein
MGPNPQDVEQLQQFLLYALVLAVIGLIVWALFRQIDEADKPRVDRSLRPQVVCPHCQVRGKVRVWPEPRSAGISGGKATGAFLTGGLSVLLTGLSKHEWVTRANCQNCNVEWDL